MKTHKFSTKAIHAGQSPDPTTGAVMPPVYLTSTYAQETPGQDKGYDYSRGAHPTRKAYEECFAALENAKYGLTFSSGMAATDTLLRTLRPGDHVLCGDDVYGGTYRILAKVFQPAGISFSQADLTNLDNAEESVRKETKMIWLETPTNPLLKVLDIKKLADLAHSAGAKCVVDNTFMSPYFQNPLDHGADAVMHSVTKYINGHSDVIGGALATNNASWFEELKFLQMSVGAVPSALDCFLVLRGIKTLPIRMEAHQNNAIQIARYLESHPQVESVLYPGLESHPQHSIQKGQARGYGGMITFFIKGGLSKARSFLENVKVFTLAESLGGVESLIEHPAIMTHASIPLDKRQELGIRDDLIRISVGIEDCSDLLTDLDQAFG